MFLEIQVAEQAVRGLEVRYQDAIEVLRPKVSGIYGKRPAPFLGEIDGVPVVEVGIKYGARNEYNQLADSFTYKGGKYSMICRHAPWRTLNPMKRAVELNAKGFLHIFGLTREGSYNPTEVGIYVPTPSVINLRRQHADMVLQEYPSVLVTPDQIGTLNISPDFIYGIYSHEDALRGQKIWVEPVTDSHGFTYGRDFGWPPKVTDFYIKELEAPKINLEDFSNGTRDSLLEAIRQSIGAEVYQWTAGWGKEGGGPVDYLFRFNHVLTLQEIADALRGWDRFQDVTQETYEVVLYRLSQEMRSLIKPLLEGAREARIVSRLVQQDRANEQDPNLLFDSIWMF